ncbi:hypothetical protein D3C83_129380 [compost metagenome]
MNFVADLAEGGDDVGLGLHLECFAAVERTRLVGRDEIGMREHEDLEASHARAPSVETPR